MALASVGMVGGFLLVMMVAQRLEPRLLQPDAGSERIAPAVSRELQLPVREVAEPPRGAISAPAGETPPSESGTGGPVSPASQRAPESARAELAAFEAPEGGLVRWVSNWANVREGRSLESPVLQVLPPGQQVVVANRSNGWWELYVDGSFVGYIAGSLLLKEPPDTVVRPR